MEVNSFTVAPMGNAFKVDYSNTIVYNTLTASGSAQFKSTINVDSEATLASATVEDLTQDRIVTVGVGGQDGVVDYLNVAANRASGENLVKV